MTQISSGDPSPRLHPMPLTLKLTKTVLVTLLKSMPFAALQVQHSVRGSHSTSNMSGQMEACGHDQINNERHAVLGALLLSDVENKQNSLSR